MKQGYTGTQILHPLEQKVLITNSEREINNLIENGWIVISITPQVVSTANNPMKGDFCILFERTKK